MRHILSRLCALLLLLQIAPAAPASVRLRAMPQKFRVSALSTYSVSLRRAYRAGRFDTVIRPNIPSGWRGSPDSDKIAE
ncbi:MAG TPA: hypothetical protein VNO70_24375 [Blastocatellia bacterium]|nr:hypothetical protein [Blastocatellia bacterium]